jgi:hypothetical protein
MRRYLLSLGAALFFLLLGAPAPAQQEEKPNLRERLQKKIEPPEIKAVRIGFRPTTQDERGLSDELWRYKVGLMAPVYVEVDGGSEGLLRKKTSDPEAYLSIETSDSEDVGAIYRVPVSVEPKETRLYLGYAKPGSMGADIKVRLHVGNDEYKAPNERSLALTVHTHLYLTLGARLPDLQNALNTFLPQQERGNLPQPADTGVRYAGHENSLIHLPEVWYGYQGVDLLVLNTADKDFMVGLSQPAHKERLRALAGWVRRGGRMVVPIAWQNQDVVASLLRAPAWQPAIPVVPPASAGDTQASALARLPRVEEWGAVHLKPFPAPGDPPVPVALLDPGKVPVGAWEVQARSDDGRPLIARVRYGLGQITYLAFSLNDAKGFARWDGRIDFLKGLVENLGPATAQQAGNEQVDFNRGMAQASANDLATGVLAELDNFDVRVIPFAYVALFIVLYIIVVGPLDFFLLKYVFKRLELTWITFPTVVIAVSVIAYFAAYAIKGNDLKVNMIDVVDFDLRTGAQAAEPQPVQAYGSSFFTILSPRIQSYTIGLEANPAFWRGKASESDSADLVTWMGRPDTNQWGMGRSGSHGFFRTPYYYVPEQAASGLEGVPIPVWTTKAFTASWQSTCDKPPVSADLFYHQNQRGGNLVITGTLENHLAVDLLDAWLLYENSYFPLAPRLQHGAAAPLKIALDLGQRKEIDAWIGQPDSEADTTRGVSFKSASSMKPLLFHERNVSSGLGNHALRPLDLGWRLKASGTTRDTGTREAILYARARFRTGTGQELQESADQPLPTRLWLGDTPGLDATGARKRCPTLSGFMNHDTYVRVLVPVRPAGQ